LKTERERMDIMAAYKDLGSFRGAAAICGVDHKTVKRAVLGPAAGTSARVARRHNYDVVADVVAARVAKTSARISAKRLLPEARAGGYAGSARNFRRLVARAKRDWRSGHHRGRRPGVWAPGEVLVIDWGAEAGLHIFCAVMAFSRWRFVRFAADEKASTTLEMLARCFEALGAVPKVVLADRMGCLKAGAVANVVVPTPAYVRFALHYGFRPDFCEAHDPESKGIVEHLVGYAKSDLVVPAALAVAELARANEHARAWCSEVNGRPHTEICAVPAERLGAELPLMGELPSLRPSFAKVASRKVDRLAVVRFGGGRYSVPDKLVGRTVEVQVLGAEVRLWHFGELVATHDLVAPGEASIKDEHYGGPRRPPRRQPRPRTAAEKAICALGDVGEAFIKAAAGAGVAKLGAELEELAGLEAAHGRDALVAALARALEFSRFRAADVRSIIAAGKGAPRPAKPGEALVVGLPKVPRRPLADYAADQGRVS
jgi:transposase